MTRTALEIEHDDILRLRPAGCGLDRLVGERLHFEDGPERQTHKTHAAHAEQITACDPARVAEVGAVVTGNSQHGSPFHRVPISD